MATYAVLGATGLVGRQVVEALASRGDEVVALTRDAARAAAVLDGVTPGPATIRGLDPSSPAALRAGLDGTDVLVAAAAPAAVLGPATLEAAVAAGVDLVGIASAPEHLRWALEERGLAVAAAGRTVVLGAGAAPAVGDALAAIAAAAVTGPTQLSVTYTLPGAMRLGDASPGVRQSLAVAIAEPLLARVDGVLVAEGIAQSRRLAWFPRPVGPSHAAAVPGAEPVTAPEHVDGLRTVRTYLAIPGWRAELVQMLAGSARWRPVRRRLVARIARPRPAPSQARRAGMRWACVAETAGDEGVARAWAYGHDPYRLAATSLVEVARALVAGDPPRGVVPPARVIDPRELLDGLSARTDLRWSVVRPDG